MELAELVIRIGEGLADRARHSADEKALHEAESAVALHAADRRRAGTGVPEAVPAARPARRGRAAVRKADIARGALCDMDLAIANGSASGVYKARDALIERYADLAQDRELIARMTQANELIRRAVKVDPAREPAATTPRPNRWGLPTSLVLRSTAERPAGAPLRNRSSYALADGFAYALDAGDGCSALAAFRRPGRSVRAPGRRGRCDGPGRRRPSRRAAPARCADRQARLAARARRARREPSAGPGRAALPGVAQRQAGGDRTQVGRTPGDGQPGHAAVAGSRSATSRAGSSTSWAGETASSFWHAIRLACSAVEYLGHEEGSIPCPPARIGRFLIVVENDRPPTAAGGSWSWTRRGPRSGQSSRVDVPGWTWGTPASSGSVIWATGDKGGIEAYALGDYASKAPLRSLARLNPDAAASGPAFGLALSERELWLGRRPIGPLRAGPRTRRDRAEVARWASPARGSGTGAVRGPPGGLDIPRSGTGGVSLVGVDPLAGSVAWQTVLGAAWPSPLERTRGGDAVRTLGQTGREAVLSLEQLQSGGLRGHSPCPVPVKPGSPPEKSLRLEGDGRETLVIAPGNGASAVWVRRPRKRRDTGVSSSFPRRWRLTPGLGP